MFIDKNQMIFSSLLKENHIYQANSLFQKKEDLTLEFGNLNVMCNESIYYLHNILNNRFWLYENMYNLEQKASTFCFKKFDRLNDSYIFEPSSLKSLNLNRFFHALAAREALVRDFIEKPLFKGRFLMIKKGGYSVLFLGLKAFLNHSFLFSKRNGGCSYSSWFVYNLRNIGFLDFFEVLNWKLRYSKKNLNIFNGKKFRFYYQKNSILKSLIHLRKK